MENSPIKVDVDGDKQANNIATIVIVAVILCLVVVGIFANSQSKISKAKSENDELNALLSASKSDEKDLQERIDELEKKLSDLEYAYVPAKRAILDAEYAEDIAAACEGAKTEFDQPVLYVSASYKSSDKIWPIVYSSAQFAAEVEACSSEVRNAKLAEAAIGAAKAAQASACEAFAAAGNYAPSDQDIATSGKWLEEWGTYYSASQYVSELKACAKSKKPKTVVAGKTVTRSGGGGTPAPAPVNNCHPSYSPCIPNGPDLDCPDIGFSVAVRGPDSYRLDRDGDGIGCEAN